MLTGDHRLHVDLRGTSRADEERVRNHDGSCSANLFFDARVGTLYYADPLFRVAASWVEGRGLVLLALVHRGCRGFDRLKGPADVSEGLH